MKWEIIERNMSTAIESFRKYILQKYIGTDEEQVLPRCLLESANSKKR